MYAVYEYCMVEMIQNKVAEFKHYEDAVDWCLSKSVKVYGTGFVSQLAVSTLIGPTHMPAKVTCWWIYQE